MKVSPHNLGVVLGAFAGMVHFIWAALVAARVAQPLLYYVLYFHFLTVPVRVEPFDFIRAMILVAGTSAAGYLVGALFGSLWNGLNIPHRIRKK